MIAVTRGAKLENYVHPYYLVENYKKTYSGVISLMPDSSMWVSDMAGFVVKAPDVSRPPGRPKKNRFKSSDEYFSTKGKHKCKTCGKLGHQARTCKESFSGTPTVPSTTSGRTTKRKKRETIKDVETGEGPSFTKEMEVGASAARDTNSTQSSQSDFAKQILEDMLQAGYSKKEATEAIRLTFEGV